MEHIQISKHKTVNPAHVVWAKVTSNDGIELKLSLNYTLHVHPDYVGQVRLALDLPTYDNPTADS